MKEEIKKLFKETISDTPHPLPLRYYGRLQTLAGLVYDKETDSNMDDELNELSNYVQLLSNLDELEGHVRQLVPSRMDFHHMFDTGLDYRHQNLAQVTINFPQTITFPEMNQEVSEDIIIMVLEKFKSLKTFDFSVPKIIGWIKTKVQFDENTDN
ncbi:MAG: hypothetical protein HUU54_13035 [Ignavibacteriaceae bacterium]|nr:hypothetical protein [Ignavibacteriaceae bacterium]